MDLAEALGVAVQCAYVYVFLGYQRGNPWIVYWRIFNLESKVKATRQYILSGKESGVPGCQLTMRAPDLGYAPRFLGIFLAVVESRFEGESTLPPQAGNASR